MTAITTQPRRFRAVIQQRRHDGVSLIWSAVMEKLNEWLFASPKLLA